jgi:hypothetical protein
MDIEYLKWGVSQSGCKSSVVPIFCKRKSRCLFLQSNMWHYRCPSKHRQDIMSEHQFREYQCACEDEIMIKDNDGRKIMQLKDML